MFNVVKPTCAAAAATLLATLSACAAALPAPAYPSFDQGAYRIDGVSVPANGAASVATIIYRDGPSMRFETRLAGDAIISDDSTGEAYLLTAATSPRIRPPAATPATRPFLAAMTGAQAPSAALATGVARRIASADAPQPLEAPWAALNAKDVRSPGLCAAAGEQGRQWTRRRRDDGVSQVACISDDGIVLEIQENERVAFQATSLVRGPQDPALFKIPSGYEIVELRVG